MTYLACKAFPEVAKNLVRLLFPGMEGAERIQRTRVPVFRNFDADSSTQLTVLEFKVKTIFFGFFKVLSFLLEQSFVV